MEDNIVLHNTKCMENHDLKMPYLMIYMPDLFQFQRIIVDLYTYWCYNAQVAGSNPEEVGRDCSAIKIFWLYL